MHSLCDNCNREWCTCEERFENEKSEKIEIEKGDLQMILYRLDWIGILKDAIEARPTSWGFPTKPAKPEEMQYPVNEWRNASDELIAPIWRRLEQEIEERSKNKNE